MVNIRNYIKSLLALKCMTIKELAEEMTRRTGKNYTLDSLIGKLKRETLTLKEAYVIADILGYKLEFTR